MRIYLIGSLRNEKLPELGNELRREGYEVFDDWFAAGPEADDYWQRYEMARGHTYAESLHGLAAGHVFEFDRKHLYDADAGILVLPAGRSAHIELGVLIGRGKKTYILLDGEPERFDVMYRCVNDVFTNKIDLFAVLKMNS
mgnify:CR=1 FL=1